MEVRNYLLQVHFVDKDGLILPYCMLLSQVLIGHVPHYCWVLLKTHFAYYTVSAVDCVAKGSRVARFEGYSSVKYSVQTDTF